MTDTLLKIDGLSVSYGKIAAVRDAAVEAKAGQIVTIIGPNGAGKSSLLKAIMGMVPSSGSVLYDGQRIGDLDKPLLTESEAASGLQSLVPQPYVSERAQREFAHEGIILVKPQGSLEETRIGSQVRPKHDVLKHGHGGPQLHVLEGAR